MGDLGRVLVTGAAGRVGRGLRDELRGRFPVLRLFDLDLAGLEPRDGEELVRGDLLDPAAVGSAVRGCDAIVHLAAISDEVAPFADILAVNVGGTQAVLEAARRHGVRRVVLASSSRVTGLHPRGERLGPGAAVRPDTFYAVSKVACEALGRFYAERFGLEVACLRIGSYEARPQNVRHLSTWLSPRDLAAHVVGCLTAEHLSYTVLYAASDNRRRWWDDAQRRRLGIELHDDAERFAGDVGPDLSTRPDVQGLPAPDAAYDAGGITDP